MQRRALVIHDVRVTGRLPLGEDEPTRTDPVRPLRQPGNRHQQQIALADQPTRDPSRTTLHTHQSLLPAVCLTSRVTSHHRAAEGRLAAGRTRSLDAPQEYRKPQPPNRNVRGMNGGTPRRGRPCLVSAISRPTASAVPLRPALRPGPATRRGQQTGRLPDADRKNLEATAPARPGLDCQTAIGQSTSSERRVWRSRKRRRVGVCSSMDRCSPLLPE